MNGETAEVTPITAEEFALFQRFIYDLAGIALTPQKQQLVATRLYKRLVHHGLASYRQYFDLVNRKGQEAEKQVLVDLLTTNETYFFREPFHFDFLAEQVLPGLRGRPARVWSAACSSGEEVYTLAMVCAEVLGRGDWEVLGSDISQRMLAAARAGVYPVDRARAIPREYLTKYCLKGVRSQAGKLLMDRGLRDRVRFTSVNLTEPLRDHTLYDVIFLRNVLIYFDTPTKKAVVERLAGVLRPGGTFFVSHVESLHGVTDVLQMVRPSIFRRPAPGPADPGRRR